MNQIFVIKPYLWQGTWVFDDPAVGLNKEPFVAGVPEMIRAATERAGIAQPEKGFVAVFSAEPFPGAEFVLERVRSEGGGNVYRWQGLEGWLCPALFRYFPAAPERLHVQLKPAGAAAAADFEAWFERHAPAGATLTRAAARELARAAWEAGRAAEGTAPQARVATARMQSDLRAR